MNKIENIGIIRSFHRYKLKSIPYRGEIRFHYYFKTSLIYILRSCFNRISLKRVLFHVPKSFTDSRCVQTVKNFTVSKNFWWFCGGGRNYQDRKLSLFNSLQQEAPWRLFKFKRTSNFFPECTPSVQHLKINWRDKFDGIATSTCLSFH